MLHSRNSSVSVVQVTCSALVLRGNIRTRSSSRQIPIFFMNNKSQKGKAHPRTSHEGPKWEIKYSSILSLTSALDGGGWLTSRPGRFTPRKQIRYPVYKRIGEPHSRSGRVRKVSPPTGFDLHTVQLAASRLPTELSRPTFVNNIINKG